jgi:hypothetical protein
MSLPQNYALPSPSPSGSTRPFVAPGNWELRHGGHHGEAMSLDAKGTEAWHDQSSSWLLFALAVNGLHKPVHGSQ